MERFVVWLMGKQSQAELKPPDGVTDRAWRDQTAWCWSVAPYPELTGEAYPVILLDGIGVPDRIRTYDLRLRKPTLYPAELRVLKSKLQQG